MLCGTTGANVFNFSNEREQCQCSEGGVPANGAGTENQLTLALDGENAQMQAANYVPLSVPHAVPLNPDMIMALAAGGMFSFQAADHYVILTDKQRKTLAACFFQENVT